MNFEEKTKAHTEQYLRTLRMWINKHLQGEVNPEEAINKIRSMDRKLNDKLVGIRNIQDSE